jgi:hypothetical protein
MVLLHKIKQEYSLEPFWSRWFNLHRTSLDMIAISSGGGRWIVQVVFFEKKSWNFVDTVYK